MRRLQPLIVFGALMLGLVIWQTHRAPAADSAATARTSSGQNTSHTSSLPTFLPAEARGVLKRIADGGPFDHRQDGGVFGNYEARLPAQPRGYYHEYTVETPGANNRGTRRIITGGTPPVEWYYTDDHYRSFRRFEVQR